MIDAAIDADDAPAQPFRATRVRLSLRTRVAINVVAVTALIQLILGVITFLYFRSTIDEFFNNRLKTRLTWAAQELVNSPNGVNNDTLETISERTVRLVIFNSLVLVARDPSGHVLATSDPNTDTSLLPPRAKHPAVTTPWSS